MLKEFEYHYVLLTIEPSIPATTPHPSPTPTPSTILTFIESAMTESLGTVGASISGIFNGTEVLHVSPENRTVGVGSGVMAIVKVLSSSLPQLLISIPLASPKSFTLPSTPDAPEPAPESDGAPKTYKLKIVQHSPFLTQLARDPSDPSGGTGVGGGMTRVGSKEWVKSFEDAP